MLVFHGVLRLAHISLAHTSSLCLLPFKRTSLSEQPIGVAEMLLDSLPYTSEFSHWPYIYRFKALYDLATGFPFPAFWFWFRYFLLQLLGISISSGAAGEDVKRILSI